MFVQKGLLRCINDVVLNIFSNDDQKNKYH